MNFAFEPWLTIVLSGVQYVLWLITATLILQERRFSWPITILIYLISIVAFYAVSYLPVLSALRIILGFAPLLISTLICFRRTWYRTLFVAALIMIVEILSEILGLTYLPSETPVGKLPLVYQIAANLVFLFIHVALLTIMVFLVRSFDQRYSWRVIAQQSLLFLLFPLSQYFSFSGWFINTPPYLNVTGRFAIIGVLLLFAADAALIIAFRKTAQAAMLQTQNEMLTVQVAAEREHYAEIASSYENIRRMRHDIDNHMYVIRALLADQKTTEATAYAEEVYRAWRQATTAELPGCENSVLASFLAHKQQELSEKDITLVMNLAVPAQLNISNIDLCCALGNMLDNASDACRGVQDAQIHLHAKFMDPYFQINVQNPVSPAEMLPAEKPRRIPDLSRGIGSTILSHLAEQYDGYYEHKKSDGIYVSHLYLKNDTVTNSNEFSSSKEEAR